jgi:hypothetical protein
MIIPQAPGVDQNRHSGAPSRSYAARSGAPRYNQYDSSMNPNQPHQPPIKKRLPLPKNVVLLSLIEATELAAEDAAAVNIKLSDSPLINVNHSMLDVEEDEEAKIKTGTSLAISDCGTYAVVARDGLEIYPSRPSTLQQDAHGDESQSEDVDTLVRFFHLDKMDVESADPRKESKESGIKQQPPGSLSCGDRVQIVSTDAGWAKLARGYGYIRSERHQLVKGTSIISLLCRFAFL